MTLSTASHLVQPTLASARLLLRPYCLADAPEVRRLAGERLVAEPTAAVAHPYPEGAAQSWIATHADAYAARKAVSYAITLRETARLVGTVSLLDMVSQHARAELGYWVGLEHWGRGYCTEAVGMLLAFAQDQLDLSRFVARCLASNAGSARVLEKCGFVPEGRQVKHVHHQGRYEDMLLFGRCSAAR